MHIRKFQISMVAFLVAAAAGCSRGEKPRARARDDAPRSRKGRNGSTGLRQPVGRGRRHARRRRPGHDCVAGRRRRQPRPRGPRRSRQGRAGRSSSSIAKSSQYNLEIRRRRWRARWRSTERPSPDTCRRSSKHRTCRRPRRSSAGEAGIRACEELNKRQLVPEAGARRRRHDPAREAGGLRLRAAERQEPARGHRRVERDVKLADRQLRDASIRAPFDGYVQKRLVSLGEFVKSQTPVMNIVRVDPLKVTAEIPEAHGAVGPGRPAGRPAGRRVSRQGDHRQGVADQPGRQHADARVPVRSAGAQRRGRCSSRARSPACTSTTALVEPVLTHSLRGHAVPLRRQPRLRRHGRSPGGARS